VLEYKDDDEASLDKEVYSGTPRGQLSFLSKLA